MATFLEICKDMAREAGISGGIPSVTGQAGEAGRVVNWVARAYKYIQNLHPHWKFMRQALELSLTAGKAEYTADELAVADFGEWSFMRSWRSYRPAMGYADEQPVQMVDYEYFDRVYGYGSSREMPGRPQVVAVAPDQSLLFWPKPDEAYTIVGEQYRAPHNLLENGDTPIFPARYHDAIMYRALMLYGEFEGDATVIATGQSEFMRELAPLEAANLPTMRAAGPMA